MEEMFYFVDIPCFFFFRFDNDTHIPFHLFRGFKLRSNNSVRRFHRKQRWYIHKRRVALQQRGCLKLQKLDAQLFSRERRAVFGKQFKSFHSYETFPVIHAALAFHKLEQKAFRSCLSKFANIPSVTADTQTQALRLTRLAATATTRGFPRHLWGRYHPLKQKVNSVPHISLAYMGLMLLPLSSRHFKERWAS